MSIDNWINLIAAILVAGGTLFLGIMAWRTIRQTRSIQKAEKRERLLNEIIEWAKNSLAILTKYPTVHFENLEDLLVRANVLKAERYAVIIKAEGLKQEIKTLVDNASEKFDDFVQGADKQASMMGRKQKIEITNELISTFENLIEQIAKLRKELQYDLC